MFPAGFMRITYNKQINMQRSNYDLYHNKNIYIMLNKLIY